MAANADKHKVFSRFANWNIQIYRCFAHSERGERGEKNGCQAKCDTKKVATASVYGILVATRKEPLNRLEKKCHSVESSQMSFMDCFRRCSSDLVRIKIISVCTSSPVFASREFCMLRP